MAERGGLVVETGEGLLFLGTDVASRIVALGPVTTVDALPPPCTGVALAEGEVVVVIRLGPFDPGGREAILCEIGEERLALVGARPVASGLFETSDDGVLVEGRRAAHFDVPALLARVEAKILAARAARRRRRA